MQGGGNEITFALKVGMDEKKRFFGEYTQTNDSLKLHLGCMCEGATIFLLGRGVGQKIVLLL